jgi:Domain of unknown function (DUF4062)
MRGRPTRLERLRVFVASPGDVQAERGHAQAVADELNRGIAAEAGFVLEVVRWETHSRPDMGRPEQLILDQIGHYDLFVGIMWRRFGTPTGVAGSGTEEEFDHALRAWHRSGQPRMLCYFSLAASAPPATVDEAEQLLTVVKFRAQVESQGLAWRYRSDGEFKDLLREHLQQILLREFAGRRPPLDRNLLALLDTEKERCRDRDVAFVTPNLLVALLGARTGAARVIADRACPGVIEDLLSGLRRYEPLDQDGVVRPFEEFDWYDRDDVQAARCRAQEEDAAAINARHLLYGFLTTPGDTRSALTEALGEQRFRRLVQASEEGDRAEGTPGIRDFLTVTPTE